MSIRSRLPWLAVPLLLACGEKKETDESWEIEKLVLDCKTGKTSVTEQTPGVTGRIRALSPKGRKELAGLLAPALEEALANLDKFDSKPAEEKGESELMWLVTAMHNVCFSLAVTGQDEALAALESARKAAKDPSEFDHFIEAWRGYSTFVDK
jgi:hypothetical protein